MHLKQFAVFGKRYKTLQVINCTPNSALHCFPCQPYEFAEVATLADTAPRYVQCTGWPA